MKVGAVDADQHQSLGGRYGVRGFPTIKVGCLPITHQNNTTLRNFPEILKTRPVNSI